MSTNPSTPRRRWRRPLHLGLLVISAAIGWFAVQAMSSSAAGVGPLTVDESGHWFEYAGDGTPYFMAGSGGPEGFLYYSESRKQEIVDQLIAYDVRAVYIHAVRAYGGDGGSSEHPFLDGSDPAAGVDPAVLDEWDSYLSQLDQAGIVVWFHLYDDGARPFGACNPDLPAAERDFVRTIVERFRDYQHLVWLPTEEHHIKACGDNSVDTLKAAALAAEIRVHDDLHPVGVHHNNGQSNQYLGNDDIDVFSQQVCQQSGILSPEGLHSVAAWGEDVYVMAECHPWHKDLLDAGDRTTLRRTWWGSVMGGGYLLFYDAWESTDPTPQMLADLGRINEFMDRTSFHLMEPADQLAAGGTDWVLGNTEQDLYILYSNDGPGQLGVEGLGAGTYRLQWFDPADGDWVEQVTTVSGGTTSFVVPGGLGDEIALSLERTGDDPAPTTTVAPTTTLAPTTTVAPSTTVAPTTTVAPPTTLAPTTTLAPPTTVAPPTTDELVPTADAFTQNGQGIDGPELRVESGGRSRITHLRFEVPGEATGGELVLTVGSDPGAGTLTVARGSETDWSEDDLSTANAPAAGEVLGSQSGSFATGDRIRIPLSGALTGTVELVVTIDAAGSSDVSFGASEGPNGPVLVLAGTGEPEPVPTTTTAPPTTTEGPTTGAGGGLLGEAPDGSSAVYAELPGGTERGRWADCDPYVGVWVCSSANLVTRADREGAYLAAMS